MLNSIKKAAEDVYRKHYQKDEPKEEPVKNSKSERHEKIEEKSIMGTLNLPEIEMKPSIIKSKMDIEKEKLNIYYPLIPKRPQKGEPVFSYAHIKWNPRIQSFVYNLVEPFISPDNQKMMKRIKETLEEKLDVDFNKIDVSEAEDYLSQKIDEVMAFLEMNATEAEKRIMMYFIKRDFIGYGTIEALMRDSYIEDISCDGTGIPIFIFHRNPILGSIPTTVVFDDKDELDIFVQRLSQKSGKSISVAEPLLDATLPDGSRLQATLSTDIARRGSNFTIRRFTEKPLSPTDLIDFGGMDSRTLAYLWFCLENRKSMMISGGTATGKTTFLNVLSMFIKPEAKIISIEDTAELRLNHPHWVPEVARDAISGVGEKSYGSVDLYDLLKSSLRQRPDYIIVGEVRGKEAYVLFQQIATGHTGLSTIHAENMEKLIDRLTTEPINLSPSLLESLDIAIFLRNEKTKEGSFIRRVSQIQEIVGFDRKANYPKTNKVIEWNPKTEKFDAKGSYLLKDIFEHTGMSKESIETEITERTRLLEWMREKKINDYRDATNLIRMYYIDKKMLMAKVERDLG